MSRDKEIEPFLIVLVAAAVGIIIKSQTLLAIATASVCLSIAGLAWHFSADKYNPPIQDSI